MVMQEQERRSLPQETERTTSDEPHMPRLGPITERSATTMVTGDMVGGGGVGEEEPGAEGPPDSVRSSSPLVSLLSVVGGLNRCSSHTFVYPAFPRKPRSHVPRAVPSHQWGFKLGPILPRAEKWCLHCGSTSTPQWRMGPAGESTLCNACGLCYRQSRLVPEYRPRASPTFNEADHSNKHHDVLEIRKKHDHPAPPAAFRPMGTRKSRKSKGQQQPAQVRKGDETNQHLPPPPPELPQAAADVDQPAQPHAGGELTVDELLPPPDPFLFDGPTAPMIIDDDEPVIVIVIDDD